MHWHWTWDRHWAWYWDYVRSYVMMVNGLYYGPHMTNWMPKSSWMTKTTQVVTNGLKVWV